MENSQLLAQESLMVQRLPSACQPSLGAIAPMFGPIAGDALTLSDISLATNFDGTPADVYGELERCHDKATFMGMVAAHSLYRERRTRFAEPCQGAYGLQSVGGDSSRKGELFLGGAIDWFRTTDWYCHNRLKWTPDWTERFESVADQFALATKHANEGLMWHKMHATHRSFVCAPWRLCESIGNRRLSPRSTIRCRRSSSP